EGNERFGSRTKSSARPAAISRFASASWWIWLPGFGADCSRSQDQPDDTRVLRFCLVMTNGCPSGTVPYEHDVVESSLLGEINPGSRVPSFVAGHAPIPTAADSLVASPGEHVPQIMHAGVADDRGIATLGEGPADPNIARLIEIDSPAMNPDHGD